MSEPFEHVVRAHGATVLRVCRALLGAHDADDAWSETFLSALRAWPTLPAGVNVEAWLVTVARRKALDELRRRGRHAVPVEAPDVLGARPLVAGAPRPGDRDLDLWDALRVLPDKQRRVVVLHHIGGLPYADVADVVGGTDAAARRAGADGVAALRRRFAVAAAEDDPRRRS
ncbi:RNA polymerase sigma factor [Cellulomonas shaoxiangyii]|uniref:Sigma-70 family RNA polymerase sigma factor n=1 Tax=Cellulomonas shaoxiangyii TaxID=2566013 RepID=A0A4P7SHT6_9CELL|nr:sigma-70 family RNA polymerase sigma factor [Cellulomonas shaoxiangyii]QCB93570.1 sigma-70 family RNA polymerase sigma factor [Cellulomonas shaoxiangyii]TGY85725.1 sigma-70 family RNA polymerase sigma factor [Cellulomonas shaoxiangyii]